MSSSIESVCIKQSAAKRLNNGHLWVFSNEIINPPEKEIPEFVVSVKDSSGHDFGNAFYNRHSLIALRLLQSNIKIPDGKFFSERIEKASQLRKHILPGCDSCRLIFGEADSLPGLIIDRFKDYFSVQILSAGMEFYKEQIYTALKIVFPQTKAIIEKNNSALRALERLPLNEKTVFGEMPEYIEIEENGLKFQVSLVAGQKTGYYFDQSQNRRFIAGLSQSLHVLDCFTNLGGFALHAAAGGAKSVSGVDISGAAIASARHNAQLNGFREIEFINEDVFRFLEFSVAEKKKWDLIILDPPSFTKSRKKVPAAKKGYALINKLAMQLLPSGGFLASASCSHHIFEDTFLEIIQRQAVETERNLRLIYRGGQGPDHPILPAMPETRYLKFFVFQVD